MPPRQMEFEKLYIFLNWWDVTLCFQMANQRSKDKIKVQTYLLKEDEKLLREAAKAKGYAKVAGRKDSLKSNGAKLAFLLNEKNLRFHRGLVAEYSSVR